MSFLAFYGVNVYGHFLWLPHLYYMPSVVNSPSKDRPTSSRTVVVSPSQALLECSQSRPE